MAELLAGLDDFLAALRYAGIPVGLQERVWLQHALQLSLAPAPERLELKALLACTLIKQEGHREHFEAVFETWYPEPSEAEIVDEPEPTPVVDRPEARATAVPRRPEPSGRRGTAAVQVGSKRWPSSTLWAIGLMVLVLGGLGYLVSRQWPSPPVQTGATESNLASLPPVDTRVPDHGPQPVAQYWSWVPDVTILPAPSVWAGVGWPSAVAVLALLGGQG